MKSKILAALSVGLGLLMVSGPVFAHHSANGYDRQHLVTLAGTVTEYKFTNPNVEIRFEVKDENGNVEEWTAESGPPNRLFRAGWSKESLKPGDQIKVTGNPLKDGRKIMSVVKVVAPGGQELSEGAD